MPRNSTRISGTSLQAALVAQHAADAIPRTSLRLGRWSDRHTRVTFETTSAEGIVAAGTALIEGARVHIVRIELRSESGVTADDLRRLSIPNLERELRVEIARENLIRVRRRATNHRDPAASAPIELAPSTTKAGAPRKTSGGRPRLSNAFLRAQAQEFLRLIHEEGLRIGAAEERLAAAAGRQAPTAHGWLNEARSDERGLLIGNGPGPKLYEETP